MILLQKVEADEKDVVKISFLETSAQTTQETKIYSTHTHTHTASVSLPTLHSEAQRGNRAGSHRSCSGHIGNSSAHQSLRHFRKKRIEKGVNRQMPHLFANIKKIYSKNCKW